MKQNLIIVSLLCAIVALISLNVKSCTDKRTIENNSRIMNDTIKSYRNSLGQEISKRETLEGTTSELKIALKSSHDTLAKVLLSTMKNENNSTGIVIENNSAGKIAFKTDTVFLSTIPNNNGNFYPIYKIDYKDKWLKISGKAGKDSTALTYSLKNEYSISEKTERPGLFKRGQLTTTIVNLNPNTTTQEIMSYHVKKASKVTWTESLLIGVGIGVILKSTIIK